MQWCARQDVYENILHCVPALNGFEPAAQQVPPPVDDPTPPAQTKEYDNVDKFKEDAGGLLHTVASPIANVSILVGKNFVKASLGN